MADEKCFCHFMGFRVKDAIAQKLIKENEDNVIEKNKGSRLKFWTGTEEEYQKVGEEKNHDNCLYITTDDDIQKAIEEMKAECISAVSGFNQVLYENETGIKSGTISADCSNHSVFAVTVWGKTFIGCISPDGTIIVNGKYRHSDSEDITIFIELDYNDTTKSLYIKTNEDVSISEGTSMVGDGGYIQKIVGIM